MNILNLPGWEVTAVKANDHDYKVEATYAGTPPGYCPKCMTIAKVYKHGTRKQLLHDLPAHGKRVGVELTRVRYRCQECEKTFLQDLPDVDERSQMTTRLVRFIEEQAVRRTFTSIADEVGVDEWTVRRVFRDYVERQDRVMVFETPERMGIDEVHLLRRPRCVMTNLTAATIIAVLPDRTKKVVLPHLKAMPQPWKVEVVTMDMWKPYADCVREAFPKAAIVVDKFHVVRMASAAMEVVRKDQRGSLEPKFRRKLMHDRYLLLRRGELTADQRATMDGWFAQFPVLAEAYRLKEGFYDIWGVKSKAEAMAAYDEWERSITDRTLLTAFQPLLTAMHNWRAEIFAYWGHRATNALTESLNGLAKKVEAAGRGYSFEVIRAKLLYWKQAQKEARRPKFGEGDFRRGADGPLPLGADIGRLLELLDAEARRPD